MQGTTIQNRIQVFKNLLLFVMRGLSESSCV